MYMYMYSDPRKRLKNGRHFVISVCYDGDAPRVCPSVMQKSRTKRTVGLRLLAHN